MCLHELSVVDDTLEALDAPKEYQRLHNWIIRIIIGWIVYIFFSVALLLYEMFLWFDALINFVMINQIFATLYPEFVIILSALIWGTILRLVYRMSQNDRQIFCALIERTKLNRKVIYHFAICAIVNKILITKNHRILAFNNFLFKHYQQRKT